MSLDMEAEDESLESEREEGEEFSPEQEAQAADLLSEIQARLHEFSSGKDGWWKEAELSERIYEMQDSEKTIYNILYSNTEVLLPSLYSATPKPDVRPRHKGAKIAPIPEVLDRFLTICADPAVPGVETLDSSVTSAVLGGLTSAMGLVRLRYKEEAAFPLFFESVYYKNFIWPKGRKWSKLPWIAFRHDMNKTALAKEFDISAEKLHDGFGDPTPLSAPSETNVPPDDDKDGGDGCTVYEVWIKSTREVWFLCDKWKSVLVKVAPDPMRLQGFYPTPGLLTFVEKAASLRPSTLFAYYQNQAQELNRVTVRLNKVLSAIRVKGVYSGLMGETLRSMLADGETENTFIETPDNAAFLQAGGFDKLIWMLPIEKLIEVAKQLYAAREAIKQVIYELTGISDIIRGSSMPSETATAQGLKDKWGTVRLRRMQDRVANYVRDLFRLAVDCGSAVIPAEKWKEVVQMPIPLASEKAVAQQQMMYAAQMAQATGQPPQIDPAMQAMMASPTMEEVLSRIANDQSRSFTVNIQTSSTVDVDTASDKREVKEFMDGMGQLMAGLAPLAQLGPSGMEASKEILIAVSRRFKFGIAVADALEKLQIPQTMPGQEKEKGPSPEEQQVAKATAMLEMQKLQQEAAVMQKEAELKELEHALKKRELELKAEELEMKRQEAVLKFQAAKMQATMPKPAPAAPAKVRR